MLNCFLTLLTIVATVETQLIPLAHAEIAKFSLPSQLTAVSSEARRLVGVDLLKLQNAEVKDAEKSVPKNLTVAQRKMFIERNLNRRNKTLLSKLAHEHSRIKPKHDENIVQGITEEQANEILQMFKLHPVIGDEATIKYDTPTRQIGFCFGRAAFTHWQLLQRGVDPSSIGKLFAIGDLIYMGSGWKFHVATIVRNLAGGWLVIDALQDKVLTPEAWTARVAGWSPQNGVSPLRFYFTDPIKFRPIAGAYTSARLNDAIYHGYFVDLQNWFREHPPTQAQKFAPPVSH